MINVHQVVKFRLSKKGELTEADYAEAGFPVPLGECEICETPLADPNAAFPSLTGRLRCYEHIYDSGWDDVAKANEALVGGPIYREKHDADERWAFYEGMDDDVYD